MKRVLLIAYHYPPFAGSSGLQRTLKFTKFLPRFGWEPIVLTVDPRAYTQTSTGQIDEIPENMPIKRCLALDSARHLSMFGKYPAFLANPDRWSSWQICAKSSGRKLIREFGVQAIWSTYPIATAHKIGSALADSTGLPWIADFRDPMVYSDYPPDRRQRKWFSSIEAKAIKDATRCVFTTLGTQKMYLDRYPELEPETCRVIENAFDEETFARSESWASKPKPTKGRSLILLHSGLLYPNSRDPSDFYAAIASLKNAGAFKKQEIRIVLRATGYDELHRDLILANGISDITKISPPLDYGEAISEMQRSDILLLIQGSNCNYQIPAKFYEYLRCKRPILALTDPDGDTANVVRNSGAGAIIPLNDQKAIERELPVFLKQVANGTAPVASTEIIEENTRLNRTESLAELLTSMVT